MHNILIIKLRYIGDVLLATPTLRAIKAARPDVRVTMMVNRGTEDVLSGNPDLDEIIVLDKGSLTAQSRLIARLRHRRFDTVIDLTDGDRSAFLSWISGALGSHWIQRRATVARALLHAGRPACAGYAAPD